MGQRALTIINRRLSWTREPVLEIPPRGTRTETGHQERSASDGESLTTTPLREHGFGLLSFDALLKVLFDDQLWPLFEPYLTTKNLLSAKLEEIELALGLDFRCQGRDCREAVPTRYDVMNVGHRSEHALERFDSKTPSASAESIKGRARSWRGV